MLGLKIRKGPTLCSLYYAACIGNQYQLFKEHIYITQVVFEGQKTIYQMNEKCFLSRQLHIHVSNLLMINYCFRKKILPIKNQSQQFFFVLNANKPPMVNGPLQIGNNITVICFRKNSLATFSSYILVHETTFSFLLKNAF